MTRVWTRIGILALALAACAPATTEPDPGDADELLPAGRACSDGAECESGYCIELPAGDACAATCDGATCEAGMVCKQADGRDPQSANLCVPAQSQLCQSCVEDGDCGAYGDLCLVEEGGTFCATDCTILATCPEGFDCTVIRDPAGKQLSRQCIPTTGTCSCTPENDGLLRPCQKTTPGIGTCDGMESCVAGSGWLGCNARTPVAESCDNQDNDCDGDIDEDLNGDFLTQPCGYGPIPRRRECTGVETCTNGVFGNCSVVAPPVEELICDDLDDNCDGAVDEDLLGSPDACNACDHVCPPGPAGDDTTLRTCTPDGDGFYCDYIACYVPYFDVNHDDSDGCEVADDHERFGDYVLLNDEWFLSLPIGAEDLPCTNGESLAADDTTWFETSCDLKIPDDWRQHLPENPSYPNTDYHHFLALDTGFPGPMCEPDTWACAFFAEGPDGYDGGLIEVCGSYAVDDLVTEPTFPLASCDAPPAAGQEFDDCCWLLDLTEINWVSIPLTTNAEAYFYLRVSTWGMPYGGTYSLAVYDWSWDLADMGYEACPLATALDPCTY